MTDAAGLPVPGLQSYAFTVRELDMLPDEHLELDPNGTLIFGGRGGRERLLQALLANVGLRDVVRLAPRELQYEALDELA